VEDELLERLAALRNDEQPTRFSASQERLLDRPATGDELIFRADQVGGRSDRSRAERR
jgi:hypothetical protein